MTYLCVQIVTGNYQYVINVTNMVLFVSNYVHVICVIVRSRDGIICERTATRLRQDGAILWRHVVVKKRKLAVDK